MDAIAGEGERLAAIRRVAGQSELHTEALWTWVKRAEIDAGTAPGRTSDDAARIAELDVRCGSCGGRMRSSRRRRRFSVRRSSTARPNSL